MAQSSCWSPSHIIQIDNRNKEEGERERKSTCLLFGGTTLLLCLPLVSCAGTGASLVVRTNCYILGDFCEPVDLNLVA